MTPRLTDTQAQYLAFIYTYTLLHRRPPAEADFRDFFQATPPTIHHMIVTLTERGFIQRQPGKPRSITLLISPDHLPPLRPPQSINSLGTGY